MSDSDEYDKISDFESDEGGNDDGKNAVKIDSLLNKTGKNSKAVEKDDESELSDSFVLYTDDENYSLSASDSNDGTTSNSGEKKLQQTTNQKMKDLTIEDSVKNAEAKARKPKALELKTSKTEYLRFMDEDKKYDLDTKLHEHITKLCSEARRIASNEYEKTFDFLGVKCSSAGKSKNSAANVSPPSTKYSNHHHHSIVALVTTSSNPAAVISNTVQLTPALENEISDLRKELFGKSTEELILSAYDTMNSFEQHYKELQIQMPQIQEYGTDEFKAYFTNACNTAKSRWESSKVVFERLNSNKPNPAATSSIGQSSDDDKKLKNYHCKKCKSYLTTEKQIASSLFNGALGSAILYSKVENVKHGETYETNLMTGKHFVKDVYCKKCNRKLGWLYESAEEEKQKYKEGKTVLEKVLLQEVAVKVTEYTNTTELMDSTNAKISNETEMEVDNNPRKREAFDVDQQ